MAKHGRYSITVMAFPEQKRFLLQIDKPKYAMLGVKVKKKSYSIQYYEGGYNPDRIPKDIILHIEGYVESFRRAYSKDGKRR